MQLNKLRVYLYDKPIGTLEHDRHNKLTFSYNEHARHAISLAMPIKEKSFDDKNCRQYFRGLLPENPATLEKMAKAIDSDPKDTFGLLKQYGKVCAGALSFYATGEFPVNTHNHLMHPKIIAQDILQPLVSTELFSGSETKYPVCWLEEKILSAKVGLPTTHLLKLALPAKILNQYFCLRLAAALGIHTVNVKHFELAEGAGLLAERYDRKIVHFQHIQYFHQEDFAQALGYFADEKYEWEEGPSLIECFGLLQKTLIPAISRLQLMKRVMFHYFIGNTQVHAKNLSLLYMVPHKPVLAPLYTALASIDDTQRLAMKIGEHDEIAAITLKDWQLFCHAIHFSFPILKQMLREFANAIQKNASVQREKLHAEKYPLAEIDLLIAAIERRTERIKEQLAHPTGGSQGIC